MAADIQHAMEGILLRGYLEPGLDTPRVIFTYVTGKTAQMTTLAYPALKLEPIADRQGFAAVVGPPVVIPQPDRRGP